jgi:hypothetical protein
MPSRPIVATSTMSPLAIKTVSEHTPPSGK